MQPDLDEVAGRFADRVDLEMINAAGAIDSVRALGVKGTPTLIGVRGGEEVFRFTGRRSLSELEELFTAVSTGGDTRRVGRQDRLLRVAAGAVLVGAGLVAGPAWPLVGIGGTVLVIGLVPWVRRHA
jgi:hypothetical protein